VQYDKRRPSQAREDCPEHQRDGRRRNDEVVVAPKEASRQEPGRKRLPRGFAERLLRDVMDTLDRSPVLGGACDHVDLEPFGRQMSDGFTKEWLNVDPSVFQDHGDSLARSLRGHGGRLYVVV